ncbi:GH22629 [Drosophila grimshawi]|uniref:GH22629 n=2 Tax=Drosophila grimshawi TaxID=7222 RepID=B4JVP5_DROGR|nr:GH22629 [Drosophila grimshawi]
MEDYVRQNQRQYEAKLSQLEHDLATFRDVYARELGVIPVQADQLVIKLEEAKARLNPIELIDLWHKQCVQNYSASIPLAVTVRSALTTCSNTAQSNLNSILTNTQNTYNSLKSYYASNLKNSLVDCEKRNSLSQLNYTICITTAMATTNAFTVKTLKAFNTYMQAAKCAADGRITQAWDCAFAAVFSTSSILGESMRLIDDCIANKMACASVACNTGCNNHMIIALRESDFQNTTIVNPFFGLDSKIGCLEVKFKY